MFRSVLGLFVFSLVFGSTVPSFVATTSAQSISVSSLTLINADTNQPIGQLSNNATLNLATLPTRHLSIRANTVPSVIGSVRFGWNSNATYRTDNGAPYAFAGETNGDYAGWTPGIGAHIVTATPYSGAGGTGTAGPKLTLTLAVVDNAAARTSPTSNRLFGVLFGDSRYLASDWDAGTRVREVELSWRRYEPQDEVWDSAFIEEKRWELQQARAAGYKIVLDFGMQYPPDWATAIRPWKDQYGNTYTKQVNAIWSAAVRAEMESYIRHVFQDFGTDFFGVRLGSGGWVETLYPGTAAGYQSSYWAFDPDAMASNPVPNWRPGQPSPNDEARIFYTWYLQRLIDTVNWQQDVVRRYYSGYLLQLFAGIGVRPAGWETLIQANLIPSASHIGVDAASRGAVFDRIINGMRNKTNVVIVSTSLGDGFATAPWLNETSPDPMKWSSAHWVAYNARLHGLPKWAENTGNNDYANMQLVFRQMSDFGFSALFWAWDRTLYDGQYATIHNYKTMIASSP